MKSKRKNSAANKAEPSARGLMGAVSDLMCRFGFGSDDCKNEMALTELIRKHHAFCQVQREAATVLARVPERRENYQDFDRVFYKTVSQGVWGVIKSLQQLTGSRFEELATSMDEIDSAVGKALSTGGESTEALQDLIRDRIGTLHLPMNPHGRVTPETCRSVHDILRFALEAARNIMFGLCSQIDLGDKIPRQLVGEVPMQYWIVDLSGGIKDGVEGKKVHLDDITSPPLLALWEGLTAIPWAGPPRVNAKGFLSVMYQCSRDPCLDPGVVRPFAKKNYIIISKRFCNLTSRLGFHHATAEAFVGEDLRENYTSFEFKGGAACIDRRVRRVRLISKILERFGFYTDVEGDNLLARLDARPPEYLLDSLKVLGYVMTHTRQLDMAMCNDNLVNWYYDEMINAMKSFIDSVGNVL